MDDKALMAMWVVGAYLVGGVPFGFLIGKLRGVDVRTVGSKNIGATNVYRTVGHKWGLIIYHDMSCRQLINSSYPIVFYLANKVGYLYTIMLYHPHHIV